MSDEQPQGEPQEPQPEPQVEPVVEPVIEPKEEALFDDEKSVKVDDIVSKTDESGDIVAPAQPTEVATQPATYEPAPGTEDIDSEDITFPRLKVLQKLSEDDEEAGLFKNTLTEDTYKSIDVIFLSLVKTRIRFNPENMKGAPLCRGVKDPRTKKMVGSDCDCGCNNDCSLCQYAKWEGKQPPSCSLAKNYPLIQVDQIGKEALPILMTFKRSSIDQATKLDTLIRSQMNPTPYWAYVFNLSTIPVQAAKGSFFKPIIRKLRETTPEEKQWAQKIYESLIKGRSVATEETE